jgi:hypothetical protein
MRGAALEGHGDAAGGVRLAAVQAAAEGGLGDDVRVRVEQAGELAVRVDAGGRRAADAGGDVRDRAAPGGGGQHHGGATGAEPAEEGAHLLAGLGGDQAVAAAGGADRPVGPAAVLGAGQVVADHALVDGRAGGVADDVPAELGGLEPERLGGAAGAGEVVSGGRSLDVAHRGGAVEGLEADTPALQVVRGDPGLRRGCRTHPAGDQGEHHTARQQGGTLDLGHTAATFHRSLTLWAVILGTLKAAQLEGTMNFLHILVTSGLTPRTAPLAPGASKRTVRTPVKPAPASHSAYSASE